MDGELRVQLSEEGADEERVEMLTGFLRAELLQCDIDGVTALRAGGPPPDARAFDVLAVGALLVSFGQSALGLRDVVFAIKKWLARSEGTRRAVRLQIGVDVLDLSDATAADQQRLVELFIGRHSAGGSAQWTASEKR